jgi:hypothetical protein
VRFWRGHSIAIVATLWLLAFLVGVPAYAVITIGLPLMAVAGKTCVAELRYRRRR